MLYIWYNRKDFSTIYYITELNDGSAKRKQNGVYADVAAHCLDVASHGHSDARQACYNIVDSIYISRYSDAALAAVSYAFPAQNLMIGCATGIGVGVNSLLSRSLGEKNYKRANRCAGNGLILALFGYLIFLVFGLSSPDGSFRSRREPLT